MGRKGRKVPEHVWSRLVTLKLPKSSPAVENWVQVPSEGPFFSPMMV